MICCIIVTEVIIVRITTSNSSRTHVRLGAWFWSAQADIFFSESLHSTLRSGRRKTIVSQTMCALAEHLSQSEIELPLRNTCYYSPLAEVGVSTQTEMKQWTYINHSKTKKTFADVKSFLRFQWYTKFIKIQVERTWDLARNSGQRKLTYSF